MCSKPTFRHTFEAHIDTSRKNQKTITNKHPQTSSSRASLAPIQRTKRTLMLNSTPQRRPCGLCGNNTAPETMVSPQSNFLEWLDQNRREWEQEQTTASASSAASSISSSSSSPATPAAATTAGASQTGSDQGPTAQEALELHGNGRVVDAQDILSKWDFIRLPAELVLDILRFMDGADIVRLSSTSRTYVLTRACCHCVEW